MWSSNPNEYLLHVEKWVLVIGFAVESYSFVSFVFCLLILSPLQSSGILDKLNRNILLSFLLNPLCYSLKTYILFTFIAFILLWFEYFFWLRVVGSC